MQKRNLPISRRLKMLCSKPIRVIIFLKCVRVCVFEYLCVNAGAHRDQNRVSDLLELKLQLAVTHTM